MTDTTPPRLKSLLFPTSVNLSSGAQTINFTAQATDDSSGVQSVIVYFTTSFPTVYIYGTAATWATGATAQDTIAVSTPPGTYTIASVDVYDNAGNEFSYSASALQGLGVATSINVTGSDTAGPTLTGLSFDPTINLSTGDATFHFSASATDRSGVSYAVLSFDGQIGSEYLFGNTDSWADGTSAGSATVAVSTPAGVHHLTQLELVDTAGNVSYYTTAQLQALNLPTTVTVSGSDTVGPTLTALNFDSRIDLSTGPATFHFGASATDRSGVNYAVLTFDGGVSTQYLFGSAPDTWADGSSSSTSTIAVSVPAGVEHLTQVELVDNAGNQSYYTAAQLQALNFPTTLTVSDSDVTGPILTGFIHPNNVSLLGGAANITLGVSATDRSGINQAVVYFDKSLFGTGGSTAYLFGSTADPWTDGASTVVETIPTSTAAGVYTVTALQVRDTAGNVSNYTTAQLTALGYATTITVGGADTTPPQLTSLTFPGSVNVSASAKSITFAASATDDSTGVKDVKLQFDKSFSGGGGPGIIDIAGSSADPWTDGASSLTQTLPISTLPGVYTLTSVVVTDGAGNAHAYTNAQLQALGVSTSLNVIGDVTRPTLSTLLFPATIDVSAGQRVAPFAATASDNATGVSDVTVHFDKSLLTGAAGGVVDINGIADSWSDGASTLNFIVPSTAVSGIYNVTEVDVADRAGNIAIYTPAQLAALGIATSLTIVGGQRGAPSVTFSSTVAYASGGNSPTFSGTVADAVALSSINVYSGATFIGAATVNTTTHTWSLTAALAAGVYTSLNVVATDVTNATASAQASFTLQTGIVGQPYVAVEFDYSGSLLIDKRYVRLDGSLYLNQTYLNGKKTSDLYYVNGMSYTSYQYDYDVNGHYTDIKYFGYKNVPYISTQNDYTWSSVTKAYTRIDQKFFRSDLALYEIVIYNANSTQNWTYYNVTGFAYTSYEIDYDANLHFTAKKYFGYINQLYVSTESDYTWSSITSIYTRTQQKFFRADQSLYETIVYNTNGTQAWTFYGVTGKPYNSYGYDYDVSLHYTAIKYYGFTGLLYVSTENDYTWSSVTKLYTRTGQKFFHADHSLYETILYNANLTQIWAYYGVTGQAYNSYEIDYDSHMHYTARKYFGYTGRPFTILESDYTWSSTTSTYTLYEQKYLHTDLSLYETVVFNADHTQVWTYFGVVGQNYSSYEIDYDSSSHFTAKKYFGYTGQPYAEIEYDYTWSSISSAYTLYEQKYWRADQSLYETVVFNSDLTQVWTYYGIVGQAYTSYEFDYDSSGHYTTQTYLGYTGQSYVKLESFYSWSSAGGYLHYEDKYFRADATVYEDKTYSATGTFDRFYGITGQSYTSYEFDYSLSGTLLRETYFAPNDLPNEMITHNPDQSRTYSFYQIPNQTYSSYEYTLEGNGVERSQMYNFNDGTHQIAGEENNIILLSTSGDDTLYGNGHGTADFGWGVLFQFNTGFGHDLIVDFNNRTTSSSATLLADTILLPKTEFVDFNAFYAAMADSPSGAVATASNGDTLTLSYMTKNAVLAAQADFKFA